MSVWRTEFLSAVSRIEVWIF